MHIEILVDDEAPRIYSLERPKIVVGSHESCDIVISHKSISRKHIVISLKDEKYYVADQGSSNGSFINEHRLIPGSTVEFSTFFPVRLGNNVLMTLLYNEDVLDLGPLTEFNNQGNSAFPVSEESTKMISLKDLHKSSTADLVKKRTQNVAKVAPPKKDHASNVMMGVIGLLIVTATGCYQFYFREVEAKFDPKAETETEAEVVVIDDRPVKRVDDSHLPTSEAILAVVKNPKCSTDFEKNICFDLPLIHQEKWGTVLYDKTIVIVADGLKYATLAKSYVKSPRPMEQGGSQAEIDAYQINLNLMMLMLWMKETLPLEPKETPGIHDLTLVVAFVQFTPVETVLYSSSALVPENFFRLKKRIQDKHFIDAKKNGAAEFFYAVEYLRFL